MSSCGACYIKNLLFITPHYCIVGNNLPQLRAGIQLDVISMNVSGVANNTYAYKMATLKTFIVNKPETVNIHFHSAMFENTTLVYCKILLPIPESLNLYTSTIYSGFYEMQCSCKSYKLCCWRLGCWIFLILKIYTFPASIFLLVLSSDFF